MDTNAKEILRSVFKNADNQDWNWILDHLKEIARNSTAYNRGEAKFWYSTLIDLQRDMK